MNDLINHNKNEYGPISQVNATSYQNMIQTEAERRRREAGVQQAMENGLRLCLLRARPKAERVFAEYENFLNLATRPDPTRPDRDAFQCLISFEPSY